MALTKKIEVDRIEIVGEFRHMQIREAIVIEEDGVEISRTHHRRVIEPNADVSAEPTELKAVSQTVHTPERKQKWIDKKAADEDKKAADEDKKPKPVAVQ